jgi:hypothetical protein
VVAVGLVVGVGPGERPKGLFAVDKAYLPVDPAGEGYPLGVILGGRENELPQGEQAWIQIDFAPTLLEKELFQFVTAELDRREFRRIYQLFEREKAAEDFTPHLTVIIVGKGEGKEAAPVIHGTELNLQLSFHLRKKLRSGDENSCDQLLRGEGPDFSHFIETSQAYFHQPEASSV